MANDWNRQHESSDLEAMPDTAKAPWGKHAVFGTGMLQASNLTSSGSSRQYALWTQ